MVQRISFSGFPSLVWGYNVMLYHRDVTLALGLHGHKHNSKHTHAFIHTQGVEDKARHAADYETNNRMVVLLIAYKSDPNN